ncbi:hypothetical protein ACFE04_004051 [Oxalis oulophora]
MSSNKIEDESYSRLDESYGVLELRYGAFLEYVNISQQQHVERVESISKLKSGEKNLQSEWRTSSSLPSHLLSKLVFSFWLINCVRVPSENNVADLHMYELSMLKTNQSLSAVGKIGKIKINPGITQLHVRLFIGKKH